MGLPLCSLLDPAPQPFNLMRRELSSCFHRRHSVLGITGGDAPDEFAPCWLAGNYGEMALDGGLGASFEIKPKPGFTLGLIRAMALEAGVGKNRTDVAVELDLAWKRWLCGTQGGREHYPSCSE